MVLYLFPNAQHLYTTTRLKIICSVFVDAAVDTSIRAVNTWSGPNGTLEESRRVHISNDVAYTTSYQSSVTFTYLQSSDSGTYTCSVAIYDVFSSSYVMDSAPTAAYITMSAG